MPNNNPHKIVLLDADKPQRDYLKSAILQWGYRPFSFDNEYICLENILPLNPDLLISGNLGTQNTISFINSLKMIKYDLPVLLLCGDKIVQDYLYTNGFSDIRVIEENTASNEFKKLLMRSLDTSNRKIRNGNLPFIVGNSPDIVKLRKLIPKVNQTEEAILIQGEPGTGKELLARTIHEHSDRKNLPFIKVNAVSLPYRLLENELFGSHQPEVPDFPRHKNGTLVAIPRCTLFLKQVGVIPESFQSKLLQFVGVGAPSQSKDSNNDKVSVRIIASTNRNLESLAMKKLFRKDLYYRMNVLTLKIPPLRRRIDDIPALTDFFCYKHCIEFGHSFFQISSHAKNRLCDYHWPGNISELENVVKNIVIMGDEDHVLEKLFSAVHINRLSYDVGCNKPNEIINDLLDIKSYLQKTNNYSLKAISGQFAVKAERFLIRKVLSITNWNRKKAAELLEISYKSLLNKLKLYNI